VIAVVWPDCNVTYVGQQHAFGKPIAASQGVSLPLAEHATPVEAWQCRERDQCGRRQSSLRGRGGLPVVP
jgi:alkylation response protein AidB-like acyl-CoA dehydrogenase